MSWSPHGFGIFVPTGCTRLREFSAYQPNALTSPSSSPNDQAVRVPARAAYSHSSSMGKRYPSDAVSHVTSGASSPQILYAGRRPSRPDSILQNKTASYQLMLS